MQSTIPSQGSARVDEVSPGADTLFCTLYAELHRMARRELARIRTPAQLGVTTLLHEAYLDMAGQASPPFADRAHFMGYAARVMRGLIIDNLRRHRSIKRGGEFQIIPIDGHEVEAASAVRELTVISDALDQLALVEPELAQIVNLKFFCGFCFAEIGAMLQLSERTVQRKWEKARIYLHSSLVPSFSL
jgi:RNA polymerase sigma factor (TIGR02999 family)